MSSASVKSIDILKVDLPLRKAFKHALHVRRVSDSVFVKVHMDNGIVGYGESLPREYVTNETTESVSRRLREVLPNRLLGAEFISFKKGVEFLAGFKELDGAARCCVETALLDALGKCFNESLSTVVGRPSREILYSSGVISAGSAVSTIKSAVLMKAFRFRSIKVKVGVGDDLERLKIVRNILGDKMDIRVDANCAWGPEEAIEKISQMRRFGIKAVEQPVGSYDIQGFKKVTDAVPEAVIADESLSTVEDAERFAKIKACDMFNIRLSKCGGLLNALKIADIARKSGIKYLLGCQVGESGVLSAAGRHFACGVENVEYYEGSYGRFLLKEDITMENMTIGLGGKVKAIDGPGLGVNVKDKVLDKYTVSRFSIE